MGVPYVIGYLCLLYLQLEARNSMKFKDAWTLPLAKDNYYEFYGSSTKDNYVIMEVLNNSNIRRLKC